MTAPRAVFAPHALEIARLAARGGGAADIARALGVPGREVRDVMARLDAARAWSVWRGILDAATGWVDRGGAAGNVAWAAALAVPPAEIVEIAARGPWSEAGVEVALAWDIDTAVIKGARRAAGGVCAGGSVRRPLVLALVAYGVLAPVRESGSVTVLAPAALAPAPRGSRLVRSQRFVDRASRRDRPVAASLERFLEAWAVSGVVEHASIVEARRRMPPIAWLCLAAAADGAGVQEIERRWDLPARSGKVVLELALDFWRWAEAKAREPAA